MLTNSIINDIKHWIRYGNMVTWLILINVAVFFPLAFLNVGAHMMDSYEIRNLVIGKIGVTASLPELLHQPWSLFTYMFAHEGVFHILFNMLALYFFGEIFVLFLGDRKVLPLYLIGGLAGAALYMLAFNVFPVFETRIVGSHMIGASASVYAITFAAATLSPDYEMRFFFFGNVRIKYLALGALLLGLIAIPKGNEGGYISHLGGAIAGYLYVKALRGGIRIANPFEKVGSLFKPKKKVKVSYRNTDEAGAPKKPRSGSEQARIDEILDKISRSGYDSLTKEERDFLFHYSKK